MSIKYIRCAKRRIYSVDIMHLFYAVTYKLKMTASLNTIGKYCKPKFQKSFKLLTNCALNCAITVISFSCYKMFSKFTVVLLYVVSFSIHLSKQSLGN